MKHIVRWQVIHQLQKSLLIASFVKHGIEWKAYNTKDQTFYVNRVLTIIVIFWLHLRVYSPAGGISSQLRSKKIMQAYTKQKTVYN